MNITLINSAEDANNSPVKSFSFGVLAVPIIKNESESVTVPEISAQIIAENSFENISWWVLTGRVNVRYPSSVKKFL